MGSLCMAGENAGDRRNALRNSGVPTAANPFEMSVQKPPLAAVEACVLLLAAPVPLATLSHSGMRASERKPRALRRVFL